ncbi:Stk1 family PASTA domain-containing Ser/Thr kinase [Nocardiopsis composta]|uniref:non-specific serine/threonine protein kinase n=1 Tax=Nocardiopsis composta TaxID=157465 RepID=A0A7W8QSG3_9ACTN|nr:Stk1 family PASTA domain-containing Ser/Thr kinase [Nocardiopsis composta]MBB5435709.1 serine/threonine-protein kinase [Nocardiopsis composta]
MDFTTADPLIGATLDRRYSVESRVASGGMATVYLAHDLRLDRPVALKVMHPSLATDPDFVRRFINEAHSAARLSHPNVVQVFDQGQDQGHVFLAMEYVPGRTLRDMLNAMGRLGVREALQVMAAVLGALGAAHQAGLVHRDVKPENVLLTDDGGVKVADFGLARAVESSGQGLTKTGTLMGTAAYLAPEQIERGVSDARSDVYAAGVMFYELLTGSQPHTGDSTIAVAYQHVNEDVPRPSRVVPGIPPEVDRLVTRATERDPRYRPGDANQFLSAVLQVSGGAPDSGPNASPAFAAAPTDPAVQRPEPAAENRTVVVDLPPVLDPEDDAEDGYPEAGEPWWRNRLMLAVGAGVLAVVLLCTGWWVFFGRYAEVPELVGAERDEAARLLAEEDLGLRVSEKEVYSDEAAIGEVAEVSPDVGESILPGGTVTVALSKGPRSVELPEVVGEPVENARKALEDEGFSNVEVEETDSREAEPGTVLSCDPEPGEEADREGTVTLTVSAGIPVPDVTGEKAGDAREQLESAGITVEVVREFSDDVEKNTVISQDPEEGAQVGPGDTVTITVSDGKEEFDVPDVTGKTVEEAEKELKDLGLKVKVTVILGGDRVTDYKPKGKVRKGDEVELIVTPFARGGGGGQGNGRGNRDD